jgi:hypothetical protein
MRKKFDKVRHIQSCKVLIDAFTVLRLNGSCRSQLIVFRIALAGLKHVVWACLHLDAHMQFLNSASCITKQLITSVVEANGCSTCQEIPKSI